MKTAAEVNSQLMRAKCGEPRPLHNLDKTIDIVEKHLNEMTVIDDVGEIYDIYEHLKNFKIILDNFRNNGSSEPMLPGMEMKCVRMLMPKQEVKDEVNQ